MSDETAWLTLDETCERTKYSPTFINKWIQTGYLINGVHYAGTGKARRFDPEMIEAAVRFQDDPQAHTQAIAAKQSRMKLKKQR